MPRRQDREPATKRRLSKDARRQVILESALQVFAQQGYEAASLDDIASQAGIARPVLYDHFRSRRDLYLEVLSHQRDQVLAHVMEQTAPVGPPLERVRTTIDSFFAYVESHPATWQVLFHDVVSDSEVAAAQRRLQEEASDAINSVFWRDGAQLQQAAQQLGNEALLVAQLWGGGLHGLARWWHDHPEVERSALVPVVVDFFWFGLETLIQRTLGDSTARALSS